jgi:hypothetical protein
MCSFVCIELGAGWGPWLVATAGAARQRGIQLAGLKLRTTNFRAMVQDFRNSGLAYFLFRGVIGAPG